MLKKTYPNIEKEIKNVEDDIKGIPLKASDFKDFRDSKEFKKWFDGGALSDYNLVDQYGSVLSTFHLRIFKMFDRIFVADMNLLRKSNNGILKSLGIKTIKEKYLLNSIIQIFSNEAETKYFYKKVTSNRIFGAKMLKESDKKISTES